MGFEALLQFSKLYLDLLKLASHRLFEIVVKLFATWLSVDQLRAIALTQSAGFFILATLDLIARIVKLGAGHCQVIVLLVVEMHCLLFLAVKSDPYLSSFSSFARPKFKPGHLNF